MDVFRRHGRLGRRRRLSLVCQPLLLGVLALPLSGCLAGAELAMLGAAAKAAEPATAAISGGKVATAFDAEFDHVADAAATALVYLGFDVFIQDEDTHKLRLDANGITADVDVTIKRRAENLTEMVVSVGPLGSDAVAGEISKEIYVRVDEARRSELMNYGSLQSLPPAKKPAKQPADGAPRGSADRR